MMSVCIFFLVLYLEMCAKLMGEQLAKLRILCLTGASSCEHIIAVCLVFTASVLSFRWTRDEDARYPNGVETPDVTKVAFIRVTEVNIYLMIHQEGW